MAKFGSRGLGFESRWKWNSTRDCTTLHRTESFVISLLLSRYDLNNVERAVKDQIIILFGFLHINPLLKRGLLYLLYKEDLFFRRGQKHINFFPPPECISIPDKVCLLIFKFGTWIFYNTLHFKQRKREMVHTFITGTFVSFLN